MVVEFTGEVVRVGLHVEVTVSAQVEENVLALAFLLAAQRLVDRSADRVVGFGRGQDAFSAGKHHSGLKAGELWIGLRFDQPQLLEVANERSHAVIAQSPRVEPWRHEGRAERVHLGERGEMRRVTEVVSILAFGERRTRRRLHRDEAHVGSAAQLLAQEREHDPCEVGPTSGTPHDHVRIGVGHRHLLNRFFSHDRLVQQHMVQHAAERVFGVVALCCQLDGLRDGDAQAPRGVWVLCQNVASRLGFV